jgi:hypothetical protein
VLSKVSFGVLLEEGHPLLGEYSPEEGPLLKVFVSQDPQRLNARLSVTAGREAGEVVFKIDTNYFLFIERAELRIFDEDYEELKTVEMEKPIALRYAVDLDDLPLGEKCYYQLSVYDKDGREDRTGVGEMDID